MNSEDSRTGSVSYTQTTSGKTASVSLSQTEDSTSYIITFTGGSSGNSYYLFNTSSTPVGKPTQYSDMASSIDNEPMPQIWFKRKGLQTGDVGSAGKTIYVPAGTKVTIRAITEIAMNWDSSRTSSFTLEENNQTVNLP